MLDARARTLYGRQLLLPEIGSDGQERLLAARWTAASGADAKSAEVCADYLQRAGASESSAPGDDGLSLALGSEEEVLAMSGGDPVMRIAAQALIGAFAAVEAIKTATGKGTPQVFPHDFRLVWEK